MQSPLRGSHSKEVDDVLLAHLFLVQQRASIVEDKGPRAGRG